MEVVYALCILFGIMVSWFVFGILVAYAGNFISRYFTAEAVFREDSKFYLSNEADKNALENFFRVDGWRNVGDGVWTKIVKVSELNSF